jgi:LysM repeat protein
VSISEHPVESGLNLTDNVKREPKVISITGEIVGKNATNVLAKIEALHQKGNYVKYIGRNTLSKCFISSFNTSHPNTIYGGCSFTMELKEVRIAKSPLVVKKSSGKKTKNGKQQIKAKSKKKATARKYKVKRGDTLWKIAQKYYGNGAKYPTIVKANKIIKSPNKINVGWNLTIPN